jgi:ABC-type nitrate/sulfonate/bicarbonate transport system substrate-binding protein
MIKRLFAAALFLLAWQACALAQEKIKVGYWTSGFSVGFGAVLEAGQFLEKEGLAPEFIRFSGVNAPTKALLTNSIDVAFGTSTNGAFSIAAQGAPVEMTMSTQVAESMLVTRDGSPLASPADFRGRKIGMSPAGSATYAIAVAVLERNYGLKPSDYTAVPGNEGQLVRFLEQGDIDAASLRSVTLASVPDLKLKKLASIIDEWKKMTKSDALPILGVAVFHKTYTREHPAGVVKFLRGMIEATRFGAREPDKAADILRKAANLDARDATSYAKLWDQIYIATFEPQDVAGLKTMIEVYHATGTLEGNVPDAFFVTGPYQQAKRRP